MDPDEARTRARILDANLNRAAEALRVAEDVCRFHWNLEGFARDLKELRHAVFAALSGEGRPRELYARSRDIEGDVGRGGPPPAAASGRPEDLASVAFRNLGRAKEALRTLAEAAGDPDAARRLEGCRYRLYAIEKGISHLAAPGELRSRLALARLCCIVPAEATSPPLEAALRAALEAGAEMVQLRAKVRPDGEVLAAARRLRELTARAGALFVVNDRPDLAVLACADGVHVGQEDLPVAEARAIVGPERLVGVSTHGPEQARAAERAGADYVGAGPVFPTSTKEAGPPIGPDGLAEILGAVSIAAFAIGGIGPDSVAA
ncbi:MAG: thiamine phosphate synthase, partial [Planctomycetota bacterium]